uniref:alpha-L-fucosidase n=1 Tax=Phallusia mammillata TaxID=59560 RepID=A0A6F9DDY2_9ASCI|nr:alpha-L-fucosidase-like [Phallusia mammillata]
MFCGNILVASLILCFAASQVLADEEFVMRELQVNLEKFGNGVVTEEFVEKVEFQQKKDVKYEPTWDSLDSRPLPTWYDEAKFGIFIHWGVFSVPSYVSEWFWNFWQGPTPHADVVNFMKQNYPPEFTYPDFARDFTTEFFDPEDWAEIFEESGAKYIVLTSKHHEGFTNWPSNVSWNWNSMDVGPHRDLVGELANAINKTSIKFGLYHSLFEWFNPLYLNDQAANFSTRKYVTDKTMPELYEIVNNYKPEVVWSDGDSGPVEYWNSTGFLAWLYNESPVKDTVVTNDRWGNGCACHHGGYYTCQDRYNPGKLQNHKWENCMTIDRRSWGYRRDALLDDYLTIEEILRTFTSTISCGGNMLMNVGPTKDGIIAPIFQERLRQMGSWLKVNGEAVYSSKPWRSQNDSLTDGIWYTAKDKAVYAFVLSWPKTNQISLGSPLANDKSNVMMLGLEDNLKWSYLNIEKSDGVRITLPTLPPDKLPCKWAWVLKLTGFD